jgi:peptide/nickel transport system substrate-binding protein
MGKVTRRRFMATSAAVAAGSAMFDSSKVFAAAAGKKIVIHSVPIGNLKVVDPIWTTAYITRNHAYMVWDTLFALDAKNEPQPQMVDRWDVSPDKLTYTFTLRDGLKWHDGAKVMAVDCVASLRRWAAKDGMGNALLSFTSTLDAIDDKSFKLVLKQPVGFVLEGLAKIDSNVPFMMPERLARTDPNTQITEVIGSGPFRFVASEWVPGSKVVYEKFADYIPRKDPPSQAAGGKAVYVDRVESIYMPDAGVALAALASGEVDLDEAPATDLLKLVQGNPDVITAPNDPLGYQLFMVLNHLHPPFDNKEVRQALLWGTKQEEYLVTMAGDASRYEPCGAIFGCGLPNESKAGTEPLFHFDLDKAKSLIKAAGQAGAKVTLMDPTDNELHNAALIAAQTLRSLGFNVDVQAMDWSTLVQRRASKAAPDKGGWNVFVTNGTSTGMANPLTNNFAKNCEQAWYGWPCDPRVVELNKQWVLETDEKERHQIVDELQSVHLESVTYVPLGKYRPAIVYRKELSGIIPGPALFYWNIRKA